MPDYKDLAQKEVIKALALDPNNSKKTFAQLLEMAYGHLIKGKKVLDNTTPKGGVNNDEEIDYKRAKSDMEYFNSIMQEPQLKKEYNQGLTGRIKL